MLELLIPNVYMLLLNVHFPIVKGTPDAHGCYPLHPLPPAHSSTLYGYAGATEIVIHTISHN